MYKTHLAQSHTQSAESLSLARFFPEASNTSHNKSVAANSWFIADDWRYR